VPWRSKIFPQTGSFTTAAVAATVTLPTVADTEPVSSSMTVTVIVYVPKLA